jgi:hypothetical protein
MLLGASFPRDPGGWVTIRSFGTINMKEKANWGPRLTPEGLRLGTPEGAEVGGATPGNTRPGRQRERAQANMHQTNIKHTFTCRQCRISNRSPNQRRRTQEPSRQQHMFYKQNGKRRRRITSTRPRGITTGGKDNKASSTKEARTGKADKKQKG